MNADTLIRDVPDPLIAQRLPAWSGERGRAGTWAGWSASVTPWDSRRSADIAAIAGVALVQGPLRDTRACLRRGLYGRRPSPLAIRPGRRASIAAADQIVILVRVAQLDVVEQPRTQILPYAKSSAMGIANRWVILKPLKRATRFCLIAKDEAKLPDVDAI